MSKRQPRLSGTDPASPVFGLVHLLAWLTTLIGVAMIVLALAGGGGIASYGVLVGALFAIAGGLRLRLLRAKR